MFASLLFVTVVYAAAAAAATASSPECAAVPLAADYWRGADVANAVDGALVLAFDADDASLESAFATEFAEPQDLRSHAVLSFTLGKSVAPSAVFVVVHTAAGAFRTPAATLFEGSNTITVDLASSEFASLDSADGAFDEPLLGLSAVSALELRLVAPALGRASASIDNMLVCAAASAAAARPEFADPADVLATAADAAAAAAAPLEFPDVAALSAALTTALAEVQRLGASLDALRAQQRAARRALDEFSVAARDSLDSAVDALATAMSANVDATLSNANVLARVRARLDDAALAHEQRIAQLDAQFDSLRSLAVRDGESLAAAVARTNAAEAADAELVVLAKRSAAAADADVAPVEPLSADVAAVPVVDDAFGASINVRARAARRTLIAAP